MLLVDYLVDRAKGSGEALALAFVDLEKAFDRVPRKKLFDLLLNDYGIKPAVVEMIRRMYEGMRG